jgi:small subunit ribosomal protein S11
MGKKRIIEKTQKELVEEGDKIEAAVKKESKSKSSARIKEGRVYIASSYNNTIITLADIEGNVLSWASAGNIGFKGTKKATAFAASKVAETIVLRIRKIGIERIEILVKGIGSGRDSAVRSLANKGLDIISIEDVTPIPHNGCKPPKARRV